MITTVTGKNQITIPAELAKQLDLQPGTRLDWSLREDGVLIARPLPRRGELARKAAGIGRKWLKPGVDPVKALIDERIRHDADEELT
jgi:AbrB family looped-hinge helix DNA binding protein